MLTCYNRSIGKSSFSRCRNTLGLSMGDGEAISPLASSVLSSDHRRMSEGLVGLKDRIAMKNDSTVRFRRLFLPIRCASGADPSILKTRSRTDCVPTRGSVSVVAAGSSPLLLSCGAPQTGTPYERVMPRNQARGVRRSPASYRRGACLFIPRTLVFRDGYPSASRRCESRRTSLLADGKSLSR